MAEKSAGEKTEKPTSRKLTKAREEGHVPQSMEFPAAIVLIGLVFLFVTLGPWLTRWCEGQITQALRFEVDAFDNSQTATGFINSKIIECLRVMSPFMLVMTVLGTAASIFVGGVTFSSKSLKWTLKELMPSKGIKQMFSMQTIIKFLLSIAKLIIICGIVYYYIKSRMGQISEYQWMEPNVILRSICWLVFGALWRICIALLVIATAEVIFQKWKYIKDLKMTKQEVKEERKSEEGSSEVKGKRRQKQFEMAYNRAMKKVPEANVVLVNPTHYAVAIKYEKGMPAPQVVAKGKDNLCEKIKEIARANGVPIIRRPPLARALFADVKEGHFVPEKLFTAVAEVLALIHRLKHNR